MTEATQHPSRRRRKQSVWFVRYGLTEHPLVEDLGPYDSDIDPGEGIDHAVSIARRIAKGVHPDETGNEDTIPAVVYASPFLRTAHTGYIVANELQKQQQTRKQTNNPDDDDAVVELRLEEGLWEWLIPSLLVTKVDGIKTNPRPLPVLKEDLVKLEEGRTPKSQAATVNIDFPSVNPYDDSGDVGIVCVPQRECKTSDSDDVNGNGKPPMWTESEEDLLARCETTLSRLLDLHNTDAGSFCVVSHAPCDQAMAFFLEQAQTPKDSQLTPWPLGGITVFSRSVLYEKEEGDDEETEATATPTGFGDWKMELYGNTEHMPGEYKNGLKKWSLPCFS